MKAHIAKYIIGRAKQMGTLEPGHLIMEAASGNTGNAFFMEATVIKDYKLIVFTPRRSIH